jgi:uncharacterized protein (DUF1697 family)
METLQAIFLERGLVNVRTYIQSGNVVFESAQSEATLKAVLRQALTEKMGRDIGILIRTRPELQAVLEANPFPRAVPAQVGVLFLPKPAPKNFLTALTITGPEELQVFGREVFIHYPNGMGRSNLKLPPAASDGTIRNLNTVAKLFAMMKE